MNYLLGKIAEIATGRPFFELVQERVTTPLEGPEYEAKAQTALALVHSLAADAPLELPLTAPLRTYLTSENGKGFWKWFFGRGTPETATCVDREIVGEATLYRFLLPRSGDASYYFVLVENKHGEIAQLRWW